MWFSCISVVLFVATGSAEKDLEWWRTATVYEVYPHSFKDSDGDGIGDLKGIIEHAEYFKKIGVDAIWISSIEICPLLDVDCPSSTPTGSIRGSMDDFDALLVKMKQIGVRLLIDFVPNHTSDEHEWFQISKNPAHPLHQDYRDFYVWHDANRAVDGGPILPNNWLSVVGGPAWTWCEQRQQFYLHQFLSDQPELNFRHPNVLSNISEIVSFWLDKGVDGFRLDVAPHLVEDAHFTSEPSLPGTRGDTWFTLNHTYTKHQPETFTLLSYWADVIQNWTRKYDSQKVLLLEVYAEAPLANKYYGTGDRSLQVPFNFMLMMKGNSSIPFKEIIDQWMSATPPGGVPTWVVGNHYLTRVSSRFGHDMVDIVSLLTGVLPGVKVVYFGEEIGMENSPVSWNQTVDPWATHQGPLHYQEWSRDFIRTPMQWDDTPNAGFSTSLDTWLPVNPNYWWLNVAAQRAAPVSHLKVFQGMSKARRDPVLQRGDLTVTSPDESTLLVVRSYNGSYFVLIVNLGANLASYPSLNMVGLDTDMTVVVGSVNSGYTPGTCYNAWSLPSKAAVLLRAKSSSPPVLSSQVYIVFIILLVLNVLRLSN